MDNNKNSTQITPYVKFGIVLVSIFILIKVIGFILIPKTTTVYAKINTTVSSEYLSQKYNILDPIEVVPSKKKDYWNVYSDKVKIGTINKKDIVFAGTDEYNKLKAEKEKAEKELARQQAIKEEQERKKAELEKKKMLDKIVILSQYFGYSQYGEKAVVGKIKNNNSFAVQVRADIDLKDSYGNIVGSTYTYDKVAPYSIWNFEAPTFGIRADHTHINLTIDKID